MKRKINFLIIFVLMGFVIITIFSVKPKAEMSHDSDNLDKTSYISANFEVPTGPKVSAQYSNLSYFAFHFNGTSNFEVPNSFLTTKQIGEFHLYFTASNLVAAAFSNNYNDYLLKVSDNNNNVYGQYHPQSVVLQNYDDTYHLIVLFYSYDLENLNITNNNWKFYLQINGSFAVDDYITIVNHYDYQLQLVYKPSFSWKYYGDITNNEFYQSGYQDGSANGYDIGYDDGYDIGYDDGINVGYDDGYDIGYDDGVNVGYDDGYDIGFNDGVASHNDYSFIGLLSQVFIGLGSFLAIELLPHITIGAIVSVPLVFGIISFIIGKRGGKDD